MSRPDDGLIDKMCATFDQTLDDGFSHAPHYWAKLSESEKQRECMRGALAALNAGGYVIVPKEPTEAMHDAARDWSDKKYGKPIGLDGSTGCYKAMLYAVSSPSP